MYLNRSTQPEDIPFVCFIPTADKMIKTISYFITHDSLGINRIHCSGYRIKKMNMNVPPNGRTLQSTKIKKQIYYINLPE